MTTTKGVKIGVLAVQGAFREHIAMFERLGVEAVEVRLPEQLDDIDGLVIPGGESTAIGRLMATFGLLEPVRRTMEAGTPVYGTCAGMILLARDIGREAQPILGEMDIVVKRNAFGRQLDSFESDIAVPDLGPEPFHAVFIRAPAIEQVGPEARELARLDDGTIVAAEQGTMLATAFHPELSGDARMHQRFVALCVRAREHRAKPYAATAPRGDDAHAGAAGIDAIS